MGKNTNKRIKRNKRSKRSKRKTFKGGMIPFVGSPLNYNIFSTYPGVSLHGGNHYGLNPWKNDLYTGNITDERNFSIFPNKYVGGGKSIKGGYMYNNSKRYSPKRYSLKKSSLIHHRGGLGSLLGNAINGVNKAINKVNSKVNSVGNLYNGLIGQHSKPSELPYIQPYRHSSKHRHSSKQKGGLAPLLGDAINGVNDIGNSLGNVYNGLVGQPSNVSSLPYIQPKIQMA